MDEKFYWYKFNKAKNDFIKEGYPADDPIMYANVFMLKNLSTGIKMYKKVDGQFKELNYAPVTDGLNKYIKK